MQNNTAREVLTYLIILPILLGVMGYVFTPYYANDLVHFFVSFGLTLIIAIGGYKKKSLSLDGAMYSIIVGHTLAFANAAFFTCLIVFFITGSRLTKYKASKKIQHLGEEHITGGRRNYLQVLCNGSVSTLCAIGYILYGGGGIRSQDNSRDSIYYEYIAELPYIHPIIFEVGVVVSLASACGDTWASEIGSAIGGAPRLIYKPFGKAVPVGTNGGITLYGTLASFGGGLVIGVGYMLTLFVIKHLPSIYRGNAVELDSQTIFGVIRFLLLSGVIGFMGSVVDSFIGGIFQFSGINDKTDKVSEHKSECKRHISGFDVLDNNTVNLVSIALMTIVVCGLYYKYL